MLTLKWVHLAFWSWGQCDLKPGPLAQKAPPSHPVWLCHEAQPRAYEPGRKRVRGSHGSDCSLSGFSFAVGRGPVHEQRPQTRACDHAGGHVCSGAQHGLRVVTHVGHATHPAPPCAGHHTGPSSNSQSLWVRHGVGRVT